MIGVKTFSYLALVLALVLVSGGASAEYLSYDSGTYSTDTSSSTTDTDSTESWSGGTADSTDNNDGSGTDSTTTSDSTSDDTTTTDTTDDTADTTDTTDTSSTDSWSGGTTDSTDNNDGSGTETTTDQDSDTTWSGGTVNSTDNNDGTGTETVDSTEDTTDTTDTTGTDDTGDDTTDDGSNGDTGDSTDDTTDNETGDNGENGVDDGEGDSGTGTEVSRSFSGGDGGGNYQSVRIRIKWLEINYSDTYVNSGENVRVSGLLHGATGEEEIEVDINGSQEKQLEVSEEGKFDTSFSFDQAQVYNITMAVGSLDESQLIQVVREEKKKKPVPVEDRKEFEVEDVDLPVWEHVGEEFQVCTTIQSEGDVKISFYDDGVHRETRQTTGVTCFQTSERTAGEHHYRLLVDNGEEEKVIEARVPIIEPEKEEKKPKRRGFLETMTGFFS